MKPYSNEAIDEHHRFDDEREPDRKELTSETQDKGEIIMKPHKCTECEFEYGSWGCARKLIKNPYTGVDSNTQDRAPNENGNCGFFLPKEKEQ